MAGTDVESAFNAALERQDADALILGMAVGRADALDPDATAYARLAGWLDDAGELTQDGFVVSDSCREFTLWRERGGDLSFTDAHPDYAPVRFVGRRVVEIGCGAGMNLLSFQELGAEVLGIEPVPVYAAMGRALAGYVRREMPEIRLGNAEAVPVPDAAADVVACISSHNYFEIVPALSEIARILRPGGEMFLISGIFRDLMAMTPRRLILGPARKHHVSMLINSAGFLAARRRVLPQKPGMPTARPVYPTARQLARISRGFGLEPDRRVPPVAIGHIFRATKPGGG